MFIIFRRLRQTFLESGSFTKYLLYAIGEILLVVIGILIALQVNNWNEENRREALKNEIIVKIKSDLNTDLNNLFFVRQDLLNKYSDGEYLSKFLNSAKQVSEFDEERLNRAFMQTGTIEQFNPIRLAFEELVSTGTVNRIENDSLKVLLFEHYNESVREKGIIEQRSRYSGDFNDERFTYLDPGVFVEKNKAELKVGDYKENPYLDMTLDWEQIINDQTFSMYLDRLLGVTIGQQYLLRETESGINKILTLIDEELRIE